MYFRLSETLSARKIDQLETKSRTHVISQTHTYEI